MEWNFQNIIQTLLSGAILTAVTGIVARGMGWIRFKQRDSADVGKIKSSTALDIAEITQKRISDEVKISDMALQWTINLASQLEKANLMIEKKQMENDRLHVIIDTMKTDFDRDFQKLKDDFDMRIRHLEQELDTSKTDLREEREANMKEIQILKKQIDAGK